MVPRKAGKRRHTPQRTCVGCREVNSKRTLIRIVRTPEGVVVDPSGKANGRGAYLHNHRECWEKGLKGSLAGALRTQISSVDRSALLKFMDTLPTDEEIIKAKQSSIS